MEIMKSEQEDQDYIKSKEIKEEEEESRLLIREICLKNHLNHFFFLRM